ncbi:TetR/AcrR family transcriptional regulator [Paenibacillus humicola]|uniref:TetR/AcrR family transcriptional regulator n=1 Tax=Paenibacillus humicola TaxID=3110540 RepID=UPI00237B040B|nr:TetR/AcrR family transcriptional regulator [Paenibacillus humicola]
MSQLEGKRSIGRPKMTDGAKPTKELLMQSAIGLFLKYGFQKVSMDDVAKEASMTKATVYYYFESKSELFKESMVALMARVRERIMALLSSDKPLQVRLFDVAIAHLEATTSFDLEGFMRESRASLTAEQVREMVTAEETMYACIEQAFAEAMEKGEIPEINAAFAAHSYIALVKVGNVKRPDGTSFFSGAEEAARTIVHVFWTGFFGGR